ncbi:MAG: MarR family transcriptional regulator [Rhodoglobus sp.]
MDTSRPIGFWLKLVDRMIDEQFASTLEEHGVTRRQWQLLNVLSREPATVEQLDAAVAPFLSAPLVSAAPSDDPAESSVAHLAELIESAWVGNASGTYELTERGALAFERLEQVVATQRTLMTEGISPDEYDATTSALERMARNLGWSE